MRLLLFMLTLLLGTGCKPPAGAGDVSYKPIALPASTSTAVHLTLWETRLLERLAAANTPNAEGALGRNLPGYFHVRFQMGLAPLANLATARSSAAALEHWIRTLRYSFDRQLPAGDFSFSPPANLVATLPPATDGDLASGIAFFASSVGGSLLALQGSAWFRNDAANASARAEVEALRPKLALMLNYLKMQEATLLTYDRNAPNRLLYDAVAYYSLGVYLNDDAAKILGAGFVQRALAMRDSSEYFLEGGGYDTSYQGVNLIVGLRLFLMLPADSPLRPQLWDALSCGCQWQATRVMASGEISTVGNRRVYPGGETFLGSEKSIAYTETVKSFLHLHYLTGDRNWYDLAMKIANYYGDLSKTQKRKNRR